MENKKLLLKLKLLLFIDDVIYNYVPESLLKECFTELKYIIEMVKNIDTSNESDV